MRSPFLEIPAFAWQALISLFRPLLLKSKAWMLRPFVSAGLNASKEQKLSPHWKLRCVKPLSTKAWRQSGARAAWMSSENLAVAPVVMRQTFITFPFFPLDSGISNNAIKCPEDYADIVSVNERAMELPYRVSIKTHVDKTCVDQNSCESSKKVETLARHRTHYSQNADMVKLCSSSSINITRADHNGCSAAKPPLCCEKLQLQEYCPSACVQVSWKRAGILDHASTMDSSLDRRNQRTTLESGSYQP